MEEFHLGHFRFLKVEEWRELNRLQALKENRKLTSAEEKTLARLLTEKEKEKAANGRLFAVEREKALSSLKKHLEENL